MGMLEELPIYPNDDWSEGIQIVELNSHLHRVILFRQSRLLLRGALLHQSRE